ncbi:MAG: hypothetical protein ACKOZY_06690 [Flavobacteriales bacterium]
MMRFLFAIILLLAHVVDGWSIHPTDTLVLRTTEAGQFALLQPGEFKLTEYLEMPPYALEDMPLQYRHFQFDLPNVLAPVFRYEQDLVTYAPCDGIADRYLLIHDSCIMILNFEGAIPYPIAALESQTNDITEFRVLHYQHDNPSASNEHYWTFESLDSELGLWLLTMKNAQTQEQWSTCWIDYSDINKLARLECYCPFQKQVEWADWRAFDASFLNEYKRTH